MNNNFDRMYNKRIDYDKRNLENAVNAQTISVKDKIMDHKLRQKTNKSSMPTVD